jgi:hypothetical protein
MLLYGVESLCCRRLKVKGMKELVQANADEKIKEDKRAVHNVPTYSEYMLGYCVLLNQLQLLYWCIRGRRRCCFIDSCVPG